MQAKSRSVGNEKLSLPNIGILISMPYVVRDLAPIPKLVRSLQTQVQWIRLTKDRKKQ